MMENATEFLTDSIKIGTPLYRAPELWKLNSSHSCAVDLWGLGCIMYVLMTGEKPFEDSEFLSQTIRERSYNDQRPSFTLLADEARDLIDGLLLKDQRSRFRVQDVLSHPFVFDNT